MIASASSIAAALAIVDMAARSKVRGQKGKLHPFFCTFAPVASFLVAMVSIEGAGVAGTRTLISQNKKSLEKWRSNVPPIRMLILYQYPFDKSISSQLSRPARLGRGPGRAAVTNGPLISAPFLWLQRTRKGPGLRALLLKLSM